MDNRCIDGLDSLPPEIHGCVLTIGNFDGMHVGHRRIIDMAVGLAAGRAAVVAMTFDPPPDLVLRPADAPLRVVPHAVKCRLLLEAGCNYVVTVASSIEMLSMTPDEFARRIIVGAIGPRHMVEGPNFFFGRKRAGNIAALAEIGRREGFEVHVAEPVHMELSDGVCLVSSTLIRRLVAQGRVDDAATCLGRAFALYGRVVRGRGIGRLLEYPTANLQLGDQVIPADGVYAGYAEVAGSRCAAAISVGSAPTFRLEAQGQRTVEAYLLNGSGDLYDQDVALSFTHRLREQRRYGSPEALKAQMAKDVEQVRQLCQ